jgi:hypothetical protein
MPPKTKFVVVALTAIVVHDRIVLRKKDRTIRNLRDNVRRSRSQIDYVVDLINAGERPSEFHNIVLNSLK